MYIFYGNYYTNLYVYIVMGDYLCVFMYTKNYKIVWVMVFMRIVSMHIVNMLWFFMHIVSMRWLLWELLLLKVIFNMKRGLCICLGVGKSERAL